MVTYDRAADVAWLRLDGWDKDRVRVQRTSSGLVERDHTGRIVGLEYMGCCANRGEEPVIACRAAG
jgi:hypothetical protein